jgi:hypothetical protein
VLRRVQGISNEIQIENFLPGHRAITYQSRTHRPTERLSGVSLSGGFVKQWRLAPNDLDLIFPIRDHPSANLMMRCRRRESETSEKGATLLG